MSNFRQVEREEELVVMGTPLREEWGGGYTRVIDFRSGGN